VLLSQDEARVAMVPTLTATLGVKGHRPVVGTRDCKDVLYVFAVLNRMLRADLIDQLRSEDYVTTARAKGASPWRVLLRHALRNSLFGLLTVAGLQIGVLLGTTVVVEQIFSVPGVGQQLLSAIQNEDVPVVEGIVMVIATITVLANLIADVLYAVLDPRIRK